MAPNTPAKDAWSALGRAKGFDREGTFASELEQRRGQIAAKAAVAFMVAKDYTSARLAVATAESTGNGNSTTSGVRADLERRAAELFKQAKAEAATDPAAAKQKYRQIQNMVDSKNQWHQRAGKAARARADELRDHLLEALELERLVDVRVRAVERRR